MGPEHLLSQWEGDCGRHSFDEQVHVCDCTGARAGGRVAPPRADEWRSSSLQL
jgi:hypothetical protein